MTAPILSLGYQIGVVVVGVLVVDGHLLPSANREDRRQESTTSELPCNYK